MTLCSVVLGWLQALVDVVGVIFVRSSGLLLGIDEDNQILGKVRLNYSESEKNMKFVMMFT